MSSENSGLLLRGVADMLEKGRPLTNQHAIIYLFVVFLLILVDLMHRSSDRRNDEFQTFPDVSVHLYRDPMLRRPPPNSQTSTCNTRKTTHLRWNIE